MYSPFNAVYSKADGRLYTLRGGDKTPLEAWNDRAFLRYVIGTEEPQPVRVAYTARDINLLNLHTADLPWMKVAEKTGNKRPHAAPNALVLRGLNSVRDVLAFLMDMMPDYFPTQYGVPFYSERWGPIEVDAKGFGRDSYDLTRAVMKEIGVELPGYEAAYEQYGVKVYHHYHQSSYRKHTPLRRRKALGRRRMAMRARA